MSVRDRMIALDQKPSIFTLSVLITYILFLVSTPGKGNQATFTPCFFKFVNTPARYQIKGRIPSHTKPCSKCLFHVAIHLRHTDPFLWRRVKGHSDVVVGSFEILTVCTPRCVKLNQPNIVIIDSRSKVGRRQINYLYRETYGSRCCCCGGCGSFGVSSGKGLG
jgi:hypothetical protein